VFAPKDAFDEDPVILHYLRDYVEGIEVLSQGGIYHIGDIEFKTPVRHQHPVETYGLLFTTPSHTISYIADTRYFDGLCSHYRGSELIIINVVRLESGGPFDHLSVPDAAELIRGIKPKAAILTHFGMTMWRAKPWEVAARLSEETGVRVIAARDGMRFNLSNLD
jgi:ribonuclease BN (tRNA processing enzyme)